MSDQSRAEAYVDKSKHQYYEKMRNDANSVFYKNDYTEIFVAAAAVGYHYRKKEPIKGSKQSIAVLSLISSNSPKLWILKAIAVSVKGIEVLGNLKEVASAVEDYANAGIDILFNSHDNTEDELYSMAYNLMEIIETEVIDQQSS